MVETGSSSDCHSAGLKQNKFLDLKLSNVSIKKSGKFKISNIIDENAIHIELTAELNIGLYSIFLACFIWMIKKYEIQCICCMNGFKLYKKLVFHS